MNWILVGMAETKRILVIDCQASGIAGDIILAALIDLGANVDKVVSAIKTLENPEFGYKRVKVEINQVVRGHFKASQIDVTSESASKRHGNELITIVEKAAENLALPAKAKTFASAVIHTLVGTEADLHRTSFDDAHLHEVALVDTAAEILGIAVALEDLGLFEAEIYSTPLAVGGGTIKFSHGITSSPAPATLAILQAKKFAFQGGPIEAELATPTGAAILTNLVQKVTSFYPAMVPLKVGYGTGTKEFTQTPAPLRVTMGTPLNCSTEKDKIVVLETNLDDVSGEVVGYTLEKLLSEGAKDVSIIPMYTKKNRPGQILKVICEPEDSQHLTEVLIQETGTLGVRVYSCERHIMNRELHNIELSAVGNKQSIRVKVAKDASGKIIQIKPEFEDLKALAEKTKLPLRELSEKAISKAREVIR
jgi:pyridinium-3,5-bisthiocarboxylic acid mononucleotide nickel chelatase